MPRRVVALLTAGVVAAGLQGTLSPVAAWDCSNDNYRHNEGTGGAHIVVAKVGFGRVADCPPGYTNNGLTCGRGADSRSAPSRVADCPPGYTNNGLTCGRGADSQSATSRVADCPEGYKNIWLTCYRGPDTYSKNCFTRGDCRPGYTDNGCFCGRGASSLGASSMTCPEGYFLNPGLGRCYRSCPEGYTNTAETCFRPASTLGAGSMTCPEGYFLNPGLGRCYRNCPEGYTNTGETCFRGVDTRGLEAMTCKPDEVFEVGRCYPTKKAGMSGNTHLWVVHRAVDLLRDSNDPIAWAVALEMNEPAFKTEWENGLWDGDGDDHKDGPNLRSGSHFYNGAGKDWDGGTTSITTYTILGVDANATPAGHNPNGRESAKSRIVGATGSAGGITKAYELGLALHYMTDATQPMHTSGFDALKIPPMLHPQYEFYAANVQGRFTTKGMQWDKRWIDQSPDEVFHQAAVKSNSFAPALMKALRVGSSDAALACALPAMEGALPYLGYCFLNDPEVDRITGVILKDGYQSTASYLYTVFKSTGIQPANAQQIAALRTNEPPPSPTPSPAPTPTPGSNTGNIAIGKIARQSSSLYGEQGGARFAVDGNTDGNWGANSVTHTDTKSPWWEVDLGNTYDISSIRIWNRTDCCRERLSGFRIFVSDSPDDADVNHAFAGGPNTLGTEDSKVFTSSRNTRGRYVRIALDHDDYLSLAEVQVFGMLESATLGSR